jgi:hypothetical protein
MIVSRIGVLAGRGLGLAGGGVLVERAWEEGWRRNRDWAERESLSDMFGCELIVVVEVGKVEGEVLGSPNFLQQPQLGSTPL